MLSRSTRSAKRSIYFAVFTLLLFLYSTGYSTAATTEISGLLEAEMGFVSDDDGSSSDIVLATFELGIDAEISEWFSGHVVLLHEEDDTPLEVDQGYITFGNSFLSSFSIQFGQQYVPFGVFETNLVSDPLTLEIAETRESAIVFAYDGDLYASFYLFNGDLLEAGGEDSIGNMGFNAGYAYEGESMSFDVGIGYINNLKDSDGLTGAIFDYRDTANEAIPDSFPTPEEVDAYVAGFTGHLVLNWGSFTFVGEMVAALDDFATDELAPGKRKPSAGNMEFAYGISDDFVIALAFQNTVDMGGYLPESRLLLGMSYQIDEATSFALEFASDTGYADSEGGEGDSTTTTMQLATEF